MGLGQDEKYCTLSVQYTHAQLLVLHSWHQPGLIRGLEIVGNTHNDKHTKSLIEVLDPSGTLPKNKVCFPHPNQIRFWYVIGTTIRLIPPLHSLIKE